jgi:hypothetical protein
MTWKELVDKYVLPDGLIDRDAPVLATDIIIAYNAQGVIDNGGFTYFFEADFPGKTHWQVSQSFLRLGLPEHSKVIDEMLALFPDGQPPEDLEERSAFIGQRFHWHRNGDSNLDVKSADNYFWDHSEKTYAHLDRLAETL